MKTAPENRIARAVTATELDLSSRQPLEYTQEVSAVDRSTVSDVHMTQTVRNLSPEFNIESVSPQYLDKLLWRFEAYKKGQIPIILQPGDAVVHQFIFQTKSWLFFTPLAHTLQIQVRYGIDGRDHLDNIRFDLTIQAAITKII